MIYKIINRKKRIATAIVDFFGYIAWLPVNILFNKKRGISSEDIKEILVIRTAYIGDILMTLPILKPLKQKYPDARITFLTSSKANEVFENNPFLDEIIIYDAFWFYKKSFKKARNDYKNFLKVLRAKTYDMVIEARADIRDIILLTYLSRSRHKISYNVGGGAYLLTHVVPFREIKHKVDYHLDIVRFLGCNIDGIEWDLYLSESEQCRAEEVLVKKRIAMERPIVVMHPGARLKLKCWSANGYAAVADRLIDELGVNIILTGSPDEVELAQEIDKMMKNRPVILAGETTIREMASILKQCDLFICNDSSPLHIASVMKTPTVAIFGPSKSVETGPYGNVHRVVEKDFPCRYKCDESSCRHAIYNECMKTVTPEDVYNAAMEIMNNRSRQINKSIAV